MKRIAVYPGTFDYYDKVGLQFNPAPVGQGNIYVPCRQAARQVSAVRQLH
jgi:hypothetical protein